MTADVVVVGAGFAGLSAAVRLAADGVSVLVVEEAPRLGGRATAFTDRDSGERVDNGQHVLFGCYRETYELLGLIGSGGLAPLQSRLQVSMASGDGRLFELRLPPVAPPWHLVAGVLRWRALPFGNRWSALSLRGFLADVGRFGAAAVAARVPPDQTVTEWLRERGQSPRLCQWLWNPLAVAALNQSPDVAAAPPFARVLGELFGPHVSDSSIGVPTVPLDELYAEPARRFIEARGGRVIMRTPARVVIDADRVMSVQIGTDEVRPAAVVSAVPWYAVEKLWAPAVPPVLAELTRNAAALESSPIVTVNLWLDGPVAGQRFVGLVDGPLHWMFDKSAIFGSGTGHVSLVASGAGEIVRLSNPELTALAMTSLGRALSRSRERRLLQSVVVREHRATFSLAPGAAPRPSNSTPVRNLFLAGDWTDTGLPATIESAVGSGRRAAVLALAAIRRRDAVPVSVGS